METMQTKPARKSRKSTRVAHWVKCTGAAHTEPGIDNCGKCMPYWGGYAVCPTCVDEDAHPIALKLADSRKSGSCRACGKRYNTERTIGGRPWLHGPRIVRYVGWGVGRSAGESLVVDSPIVDTDGLIKRAEVGITVVMVEVSRITHMYAALGSVDPSHKRQGAHSIEIKHKSYPIADLIANPALLASLSHTEAK